MRKLIAAAAVTAGLLISTTTAGAASPTASYSKVKHGTYALCVTNNLGYPYNLAQIQVTGLAKQPTGTAPANWAFSSLQSGSTWVAEWDALDPTLGLAPNASSCAFTFTQHGRPVTATLTVNLLEYTNSGLPLSFQTTAAHA
jgi:hypothetical protein